MKKILLICLAVILVISVVSCMGNAKKALPLFVKFGMVTDIESLGGNAEAIVLSMQEPSSKGAKRDVYVAAVDYLFTYASKNLKELSVTAYNPDGKKIIAFTMPSYLITALRETEANGNWGTEGFAASFYFNSDAYDVLVDSCVPYKK